jgi:hypothetical protein
MSAGIQAADFINDKIDPFEEFTRPACVKYPETLAVKAAKFEKDMERFAIFDGQIYSYNLPVSGRIEDIDIGDQCIWHGIYTAMWALKFGAGEEPADTTMKLYSCLNGMKKLLVKQRLLRGVSPAGPVRDDPSNDSLTGYLAGLYFAWTYGPNILKDKVGDLALNLASGLRSNNYDLVDASGKVTPHGALLNGDLTDPLRLTEVLALMKIKEMCGYKLDSLYDELVYKFRSILMYPKVNLLWWDTVYDTHRAAIHLHILTALEKNLDLKLVYAGGLDRLYNKVRKSGNVWAMYLCMPTSQASTEKLDFDRNVCKKVLSEFTLEDKNLVVEKLNHDAPEAKLKWGSELFFKQPYPRWKSGSQDFFWQRNLYAVDNWSGVKTPYVIYNGGDYLIAYWLGRLKGFISKTD